MKVKILIIVLALFVSCKEKPTQITDKQKKYIDSICNLPHLAATIEAQRQELNRLRSRHDKERSLKSYKDNRVINRKK